MEPTKNEPSLFESSDFWVGAWMVAVLVLLLGIAINSRLMTEALMKLVEGK